MEFRRLPQSPTLPESWRALLDAFRPAFRRSRTFALFALLATGLVTQTTRRTVVGMLAGAGMAAVVSFHAVCRFFSNHAFDIDRLGLTLARLIVSRLLAADAVIDVVVDATLFRRWGRRWSARSGPTTAPRRTPTRSAAATGGSSSGSSSRCRSAHTRCLPVLFRLWRGQGTASPVQLARELISILAQVFPDRLVHAVGEPPTTARRCWCPLPRSPPVARPTPPSTRWRRHARASGARDGPGTRRRVGGQGFRSAVPKVTRGCVRRSRPSAAAGCRGRRRWCGCWRLAVGPGGR